MNSIVQGNAFFKKGDYRKAVDAYSRGLALDAMNAVLHANKGMALLRMKAYAC